LTGETRDDRLKAVYEATDATALERSYDDWAKDYDADLRTFGYMSPTIAVALAARHVPTDRGAVLDAGAGTGIVGELLALIGYRELTALDLSSGMLEVARRKGVYSDLHQAALGSSLDLPDDAFAGVVCVGTFTGGHVGPDALPELIRVTRPGGALVYSLTEPVYDAFEREHGRLEREGAWTRLEVSGEFDPLPNDADAPMSRVYAFRVA